MNTLYAYVADNWNKIYNLPVYGYSCAPASIKAVKKEGIFKAVQAAIAIYFKK